MRFDLFFIDLDGVVFLGERMIPGAKEAIRKLKSRKKRVIFLTNNSTLSRKGYARKFARFGVSVDPSSIITSGYVTAVYLRKRSPGAKIFVVGETGLKEELKMANLKVVENARLATHVVVGLDRRFTYKKLAEATSALLSGAEMVATNADPTYPTDRGLAPGAGAIVAALSASSGKRPEVVGKPSTFMLELGLKMSKVPKERAVIVGDRQDVDVVMGKSAGLTTVLVLTGVTKKISKTFPQPDFVFNSLREVVNDASFA